MNYEINIKKLIIFLIIVAIIIFCIIGCILFFSDKMIMTVIKLKTSFGEEIEVTKDIRQAFLQSEYFSNIIGIDNIPKEVEKITVEDIKEYSEMMNKLFTALYYDNQLTKLKEPEYINNGVNYTYEYKIKSSKLIKILKKVYGFNPKKEEFASSEKYVNSMYYNQADDCCYISDLKINSSETLNFIGVESIKKQGNTYIMDIYYYSYLYNIDSIEELYELIDNKNNNNEIIEGNFQSAINVDEEGAEYVRKRITFEINSIFGKNKFKILNIENLK